MAQDHQKKESLMETENVNVKNWKSLIKPSKLDVKISDDLTQATIIAEPLEKGYGLTLGNSLRRISAFFYQRCCCNFNSNRWCVT